MGKSEQKSNQIRKRADLRRFILESVAVTGVVAVAVMAPNVIGAMSKLGILPGRRQKETIRAALHRCVDRGLLIRKRGDLTLTQKGRRLLEILNIQHLRARDRKWDKRWRVIVFDIPEKRRAVRLRIRELLISMGFVRMQDSVWAIPFDCEDVIEILKIEYGLKESLKYMIVEAMDDDASLRKHFKLPT